MADLIESIKSNPIVYYVGLLFGIALLSLIICLIIKNDRKKREKKKALIEEKARIERHVDLEMMIAQMQEQEQNKSKEIDPVVSFEQEQEEKAIISYQELVNAVKTDNKEPINVINVSSTGDVLSTTNIASTNNEPVFIDEVKLPKSEIEFDPQAENIVETPVIAQKEDQIVDVELADDSIDIPDFNSIFTTSENKNDGMPAFIEEPEKDEEKEFISEVKELDDHKVEEKQSVNKFRNSEFISPIYGRQNNNISYPKISSLKNTIDNNEDEEIINISSDIDPNDEFLKTLKDYRN